MGPRIREDKGREVGFVGVGNVGREHTTGDHKGRLYGSMEMGSSLRGDDWRGWMEGLGWVPAFARTREGKLVLWELVMLDVSTQRATTRVASTGAWRWVPALVFTGQALRGNDGLGMDGGSGMGPRIREDKGREVGFVGVGREHTTGDHKGRLYGSMEMGSRPRLHGAGSARE